MKKDFLFKKWYEFDFDLDDLDFSLIERDYMLALGLILPNIRYEVIFTAFFMDPSLDILYRKELFFTESITFPIISKEVDQFLNEIDKNINKLNYCDFKYDYCCLFIKKISKSNSE